MNTSFLKKPNPRNPGLRHKRVVKSKFFGVTQKLEIPKHVLWSHRKMAGRGNQGSITVRGRGGGSKNFFRKVLPLSDFVDLQK